MKFLEILGSKGDDIFCKVDLGPKKTLKKDKRQILLGFRLKRGLTYIINDNDPEKSWNLKSYFTKVNDYLLQDSLRYSGAHHLLLDYEKCIKYRKRIEKEIIKDMACDIFTGI